MSNITLLSIKINKYICSGDFVPDIEKCTMSMLASVSNSLSLELIILVNSCSLASDLTLEKG
jgi:hypothetical protein